MKIEIAELKKKSMGWWASLATIVALFVALIAWLWPEPLSPRIDITPTPTSLIQVSEINQVIPTKAPKKIRVLVLKFDEANQLNYRVTDLVIAKLRKAMSKYSDTEIVFVDKVVTEAEGTEVALRIGKLYNASIVIWGWYGLTDQTVPLGVHFEIVPLSETFRTNTCAASSSEVGNVSVSHLSDLTLQTNMSNELTYLTLFTIGLARYEANDFTGALNYFNDAIINYDPNTTLSAITTDKKKLLDVDLLYDYRARTNFELDDYDSALNDFERINQAGSYNVDIASVYEKKGDYKSALENINQVVDGNYSSRTEAKALYLRGAINNILGAQVQANQDFRAAIETSEDAVLDFAADEFGSPTSDSYYNYLIYYYPENFLVYFFRAQYYEDTDVDKALNDYNKALELFPDFPAARQGRINLLMSKDSYDHQEVIDDYKVLFNSPEYHTPCNLVNIGWEKRHIGLGEEADTYLNDAISKATEEINKNPSNGYSYYVRGLALENLDKEESAIQDYKKFIELDPELAKEYGTTQDVYDYEHPATIPLVIALYLLVPTALIFLTYQFVFSFVKSRIHPRHSRK